MGKFPDNERSHYVTLKPRRLWLPVIAVSSSSLLMLLGETLDTKNILHVLNGLLNLPADLAFRQIAPGRSFYGFHTWSDRLLFLLMAGLCWYVVGTELDFHLLEKMANYRGAFRFCWIVVAIMLQGLVIWAVWLILADMIRHGSAEPYYLLANAALNSIALSWFQFAAVRFWRARGTGSLNRESVTRPG